MKKAKKVKDELPLIYRLILKLPNVSLDSSPGVFQGIFWAILVPIFLILEFFITVFLLMFFPFPINIFLACSIPTVVFVFFVKLQLQRILNLWNANKQRHFEWNIERISKEYFSLLDRQRSKEDEN